MLRNFLALCAASCFFFAGLVASAAEGTASRETAIPFKRTEEASSPASLVRVVVGFGVVVALGIGAIYVLRRYVPASVGRIAGKAGRIDILEIRRVTSQLTLFLVKIDDQTVLLAQSGDRVRQIRLERPEPPAKT